MHPTSRQPAQGAPHHQNYDAMLYALRTSGARRNSPRQHSGPECSFLDRAGTRQPRTQIRNWHYVRGRGSEGDQRSVLHFPVRHRSEAAIRIIIGQGQTTSAVRMSA
jgi:hypothetical protein